jgi:RNA 3'-phosphate cyclase
MGITVHPKLILRGYYPKGGGEALITVKPTKKINPLKCKDEEVYEEIEGNINVTNLPDHIPGRIKHTAIKVLLKNNLFASIKEEKTTSLSPGVGVCLWSKTKNTVIGASFLGEKGIPSEEVGQTAANNLLEEMNSNVTLDKYAFDQVLPFLVLSRKNGKSVCRIKELTNHASTNMWLLQQFYDDVKFEAIQNENNIKISVQ